jgi:VCBS repeat-containing protein
MVAQARMADPNVQIELNLTGFSRGSAEAVAFANLVQERGIPGVSAPGAVTINSMVLFDPVDQTSGALNTSWPTNVRNSLVLVAMDETRTAFPPMAVGSDAIVLGVPGAHSDVGGSFGTQGISSVTLGVARNFMAASGVPIDEVPSSQRPDWSQQTVHNSAIDNYGNVRWDSSAGNRYYEGSGLGSISLQDMLALPPEQRPTPVVENVNGRYSLVAWLRTATSDSTDPQTGERVVTRDVTQLARDGVTATSRAYVSETRDGTGQLTSALNVAYSADGSRILSTTVMERQADGSLLSTSRDGQGAVQSITNTRVFDDGSSIATTQLPDDVTRTTTRDVNNRVIRVVEDQQVGTSTRSTVKDGAGNVIETISVQTFDDGSSIKDVTRPDGSTVHSVYDEDSQAVSVTRTAAPLQGFGTAIQDLNSLANAIRAGQPLPILSSGLTLIDNQVNPTISGTQTFNNMPLYTTTAVVSAVSSLYSLHQAFSGDGTDVQRFTTTAYAVVAVNSAANAVASQISGTVVNNVTGAVVGGVANTLAEALPYVNIALSLQNGDYTGAAVGIASAMGVPYIGWVYAAYLLIDSLANEPPEAWATGHFRFATPNDVANAGDIKAAYAANLLRVIAPGTSQQDPLNVQADIVGDAFGPDRVRLLLQGNGSAPGSANYFGGVLGYLNETIDAQLQAAPDRPLGIIPQRLPTLSWHEARQDDPGYSITDIDPITGEERLPHLRYNDDWTPYNADPTDPAQRLNVFNRLINSALEREAIAPLWEVQTARLQQDIGDPNAGQTEEVRAARRDLLALVDAATQQRSAGVFRPIALDLNGDGRISTITNADNDRAFNWDGSGYDKEVGWVGDGEGLLFLDRNLNGAVDNGRDLFSNSLVADPAKGVRSLAWVDANADGVFDTSDPVFAQLRVWQDADRDAWADAGELKSLAELGITSVDYANGRFTRNGQYYAMQSPTLETSSEGTRATPLPEGIRVEFSDGGATLYVTSVTDLGAGNDGVQGVEDGGQEYDTQGRPIGQVSTRRDPISILPSLLLQNDSVNGGNAGLAITAVGNASVGSVSINAQSGAIQFLAPQHFNGVATFEYTVTAPNGQSTVATVTVNVAPVNDRPSLSTQLPLRPIYGWAPRIGQETYSTGGSESTTVAVITPDQGEPLYAPYRTVQGRAVAWLSRPQGEGYWYFAAGQAPVDTGIPEQYLPYAATANYSTVDRLGGAQVITWNGRTYAVAASPVTYLHATVVATELSNDGSVSLSDVDGNGGAGYRYQVISGPTYGRLGGEGSADDINPNTGAFTYTGNRFVATDLEGNVVNSNSFSDTHVRGEETFNDVFTVKVTDLSDPTGNTFTTREIVVPHYGPRPSPNVQSGAKKPIAIDLNGDGFHFTDVDDSNVFFDVNGDGWRRRMAWNNPQDGLLAYDKNGDGKISDFDEISFVPYDTNGQSDLESLRLAFDTNHDGVFSAADAKWNAFGVWQDADSDGVSDPGEFRTLNDLGISQIGLTSDGRFQVIDGQSVHGTATATRTDGSTLAIADVTLRYRNETRVTGSNGAATTVTVPAFAGGQQITGTAGADLVFGTSGNDQYVMGDGNDVVNDDGGNDMVDAGAGDDLVFTGIDDDFVSAGAGNDSVFTGAGNDIVIAGDGDDVVVLEGGNDIAFGADGNDMLSGGFGNDLLSGDAGVDKLFGEGGWDQLFGGAGDDELWGMDGNDQLDGGEGNDLLAGGSGDDAMTGGAGNDTYEVGSTSDTVTELAAGGEDTVRSSIAYTLAANLEHLELTGTATIDGTGNAGANRIFGNDANNTLRGLAGNDTLDGGKGADILIGGVGDDSYVIDNSGDIVRELAGEGMDTVQSRVSHTLGDNVENLTLAGIGAIDGTGNAMSNQLVGNAAANVLRGGAGNDSLNGGRGYDTYAFARGDGADSVVDNEGGGKLRFEGDIGRADLRFTRAGNDLVIDVLRAGQPAGDRITLGGWMAGGARVNAMTFGDGVTQVLDESVLNRPPTALADTNAINEDAAIAASGNVLANDSDPDQGQVLSVANACTLQGQFGRLELSADGSYRYVLNNTLASVQSLAMGQSLVETFGYTVTDNADRALTAQSTLTVTVLGTNDAPVVAVAPANTNVKVLRAINVQLPIQTFTDVDQGDLLTISARQSNGQALPNWLQFDAATMRFTGLAPRNMRNVQLDIELTAVDRLGATASTTFGLLFNAVGVTLTGTNGHDVLTGSDLDDRLIGQGGDDLLDGAEGDDTMEGGTGNDTYVIDTEGDRVVEATNGGFDTVRSSISTMLAANVEALVLTGNANLDGVGNDGDNLLQGNSSANALQGAAGNDTLDGGAGADTMVGGQGDDAYVVDQAGDRVIEALAQGIDRVSASIDYVLPENVEQLTLTGQAIKATGNALDNLLFGNAQGNVIDGGAGNDRMEGGAGDDRYVVDSTGDVVIEGSAGGNDTVVSTATFVLGGQVENLVLVGGGKIAGTGNEANNVLVGNSGMNALSGGAGNDVLAGGLGNDTLDGGSGDDLYLYHQGEGRDVIVDAAGTDTLRLGAGMTADSVAARLIQVNGQQRLFLSILGTDGQETDRGVEIGLTAAGASSVERIELANGQVLTMNQVTIGARTLNGTSGADTLTGDRSDDTIYASSGNDVVYGRTGNDVIYGGAHNDRLFGEGGNDKLYGESEADELWGGAGNDLLDGGSGTDVLMAGTGDDQLLGGTEADTLDAGEGNDALDGGSGDDQLFGGAGADTLRGGTDTDLLASGDGDDVIESGSGTAIVVAGRGNDRVTTDTNADFIDAGEGDDLITSSTSNDFIAGGKGNDRVDAGMDRDVIAFNRGDGADTLVTMSWQSDTLTLGGGIRYADLSLSRSGNNLTLVLGQGDSVTIEGWYADSSRHNITTLQVVTAAAGGDYAVGSTDRLRNRKVVSFNFEQLVARFDAARAANPALTAWSAAADLNSVYLQGSDTQAIGGDLSYRYGTTGSYGDLDWRAIQSRTNGLGGGTWQTLATSAAVNPWTALQAGVSLIANATQGLPSPIMPGAAPSSDELVFAAFSAGGQRPVWMGSAPTQILP